jgi:hypothetical protein
LYNILDISKYLGMGTIDPTTTENFDQREAPETVEEAVEEEVEEEAPEAEEAEEEPAETEE